jgi:NAD(P)H dehydrogenase (quinone)
MQPVNVAVIHYSATGIVHALAQAAAEAAEKTGAQVRLRRVRELAPASAIDANPAWSQHRRQTAEIPEAAPLGRHHRAPRLHRSHPVQLW